MKVYLAGPWIYKGDMAEIAAQFERAGHTITHKWWLIENIPENERSIDLLRIQAEMDVQGVRDADVVVVMNSAKSEGKAVEQGIAIAMDKNIIAVGTRGEVSVNVFHYLLNYLWVKTVQEALDAL